MFATLSTTSAVVGITVVLLLSTTNIFANATTDSSLVNRRLDAIMDEGHAKPCISTDTYFNFYESEVTSNDLHLGGELRYSNVGNITIMGGIVTQQLDLVVTVQEGYRYYSSAADGSNDIVNKNGKNGQFGNINVRNVEGCETFPDGFGCVDNPNPQAENGKGFFKFTIVDSDTGIPQKIDFTLFFFDLDNRSAQNGIKEKLVVKGWDQIIYPNTSTRDYTDHVYAGRDHLGEIIIYPNDNELDSDNRATFNANTTAGNDDNPSDPNNLTDKQLRKSVGFKFTETSSFNVEFHEMCGLADHYGCGVVGGNVLFAGTATQMAESCAEGGEDDRNLDLTQNTGINGDPIILGLKGQVFKFDGRDGGWYANVVSQSFQWNMQFKKHPTCPEGSDTFVSGMSFMTPNESDEQHTTSESDLMIITTPEPIEECRGDDRHCLGDGTLHLSFDGGETFVSDPGDYHYASRSRIVAHNTYAACSRRWYDYDISPNNDPLRAGGRRMTVLEKKPSELLSEKTETMIDPEECADWIEDRRIKDDLFQQKGYWSSLHVQTPAVSFHIEYRQSNDDKFDRPCDFQSLDAWIVTVSKDSAKQEWQGILGETKQKIYDNMGQQVMKDRQVLLRGPNDADYEVDGPYGTTFSAKSRMNKSLW